MTKHVVLMIGALFCLLSCGTKAPKPKGDLLFLEYTARGTMDGYEYQGRIEQVSDTAFILTAMKMTYGPLFRKQISKAEMDKFKKIIIAEKMYKYKEHYRPMFEVKDGRIWHFYAKFSDGTKIHSDGENAVPGNNGLPKILNSLQQMIEDSTQELTDSLDNT